MRREILVTFHTDRVDDSLWTEEEVEIVPGGRAIAQKVRDALTIRGFSCSPIEAHSFYGWRFNVSLKENTKEEVQFIICAASEGWMIQFVYRQAWLQRLLNMYRREDSSSLFEAVHTILSRDNRLFDVLWHLKEDYENGGYDKGLLLPRW